MSLSNCITKNKVPADIEQLITDQMDADNSSAPAAVRKLLRKTFGELKETRDALGIELFDVKPPLQDFVDEAAQVIRPSQERVEELNRKKAKRIADARKKGTGWLERPGAPKNTRKVLRNGDDVHVVGPVAPRDWIARVENTLTDQQIDAAAAWYDEALGVVTEYFGEQDAPRILFAWLAANIQASPTEAFRNVLRAEAQARRGVRGELKAGLNDLVLRKLFTGSLESDEGIGLKLYDFVDSGLGRNTRTVYGDSAIGAEPAVADIHSLRDMGFVDAPLLENLKKRFGEKAVKSLKPENKSAAKDGISPSETQYEWGADRLRWMTQQLNRRGWRGKKDWKPQQIQAVGWIAMRTLTSGEGEATADAIRNNISALQGHLDFSPGSPLSKQFPQYADLPAERKAALSRDVMDEVFRIAVEEAGVRSTGKAHGQGALGPVSQLQVLADPEEAALAADIIGYLTQQQAVYLTKPNPTGEAHALEVVPEGNQFSDPQAVAAFWEYLSGVINDPKQPHLQVPGYSTGTRDGKVTLRLFNPRANTETRKRQYVEQLRNAVEQALQLVDYNAGTVDYALGAVERGNNWETQQDGQDYLARIGKAGRPDLLRRVVSVHGAAIARRIQDGIERAPAIQRRFSLNDSRLGRVANPGRSIAERSLIDQFDAVIGAPDRQTMAELEKSANAKLAKEGQTAAKERLLAGGFTMDSPEDVIIAQKLVQSAAREASTQGMRSPQAMRDALVMAWQYRELGSEQARAFAARRDLIERPVDRNRRLLFEALVLPPKIRRDRIRRLRQKARDTGKREFAKRAAELEKEWIDKLEDRVLKPLRMTHGIDLANLRERELADEAAVARMYKAIEREKAPNAWSALEEWYVSSILSHPATHAVNLGGNVLHGFYMSQVERPLEYLIGNFLPGDAERPTKQEFTEMKHIVSGFMRGISEGWGYMIQSYRTEQPAFDAAHGAQRASKLDLDDNDMLPKIGRLTAKLAHRGPAGKAVNLAERALGRGLRLTSVTTMEALDEFSKSFFANIMVMPFATRIARNEGLSGRKMSDRIAELVADKASAAWMQAVDFSKEVSFQHPVEGFGKILSDIRNWQIPETDSALLNLFAGMRPMAFVVPFVRVPINVFKKAFALGPGAFIGSAADIVNVFAKREIPDGMSKRLARSTIFSAVMYAIMPYLLGDDEDEEPLITGTRGGTFTRGETEVTERDRPKQSINLTKMFNIFGFDGPTTPEGKSVWMEYRRADPFAQPLTLMANVAVSAKRAEKRGESITAAVASTGASTILASPFEGTMLSGAHDFLNMIKEVVTKEGDFNSVKRWGSRVGSSFVPNIVRGVRRDIAGDFDETRIWESPDGDVTYTSRMVEATQTIGGGAAFSKRDVWGRERSRWGNEQVGTLWFNVMNPLRLRGGGADADADKMNRIISMANAIGEKKRYPQRRNPWRSRDNKRLFYTQDEYDRLQSGGGALAEQLARHLPFGTEPSEIDRDIILDGAIRDGYARQRDRLAREQDGQQPHAEGSDTVWLLNTYLKLYDRHMGKQDKAIKPNVALLRKELRKIQTAVTKAQKRLDAGDKTAAGAIRFLSDRAVQAYSGIASRAGLPDVGSLLSTPPSR